MKYFLKVSTILLVILGLIGCGESNSTTTESSLTVGTQTSKLNASNDEMEINFSVKNNYDNGVEAKLSNLEVDVTPCQIKSKTFSPSEIIFNDTTKQKNVNLKVVFTESCTPTAYVITGETLLTLDGKSNEVGFNYALSDLNLTIVDSVSDSTDNTIDDSTDDSIKNSYSFKNAISLVIGNASEERTISVYLVDKLGIGVFGKEIYITALGDKFGSVAASKAVTDASGKASFLYTAPIDFDNVDGNQTTVELIYVENEKFITEEVEISFKKSTDNTNTTIKYTFANVPSNVEVTKASQEIFFEVQLIDENEQAVAGKIISTLSYDTSSGRLEKMSVATDANGFARFAFTSADSIDDANGTTLPLTLEYREGTAVISTGVAVAFNKTASVKYELLNAASLLVEYASKVEDISINLVDSNGVGVSGKQLEITTLESKYGSISSSTASTNGAGVATFTYTSPSDIDSINGETTSVIVTFVEDGVTISETINITFQKNVSALYQFRNIPLLLVEYASKVEDISINLVDSNGVGVSGKQLEITTLESQYGSISSSTASTNGAGVATFAYTSPSDIENVDGESTSIRVRFTENDFTITQEILITFQQVSDNDNSDANNTLPIVVIENSLKTIELTSNSKTVELSMQVFKDAAPYDAGSVKVELPSKVLNGVDVGLFEAYEVAVNSQGIALFNYTGPSNLKALMDNNDSESIFKFYHNENTAIENRQTIKVVYNLDEDAYTSIDYVLHVTTEGDDFSMGIPDLQKTFSVLLKDSTGKIVNNNDINITKIEVSTENAMVAQLIDTNGGTSENKILLNNENNSPFILKSQELSGIVPLRITIEFTDINDENKTLETIVNVRVMSGPPSAISVSYVSTGHDASRAKYEETFAISVTDEYGNKVNTQPFISVGAIVGYAVDGQEASSVETNNTKRLYYSKFDIENANANGEIVTLGDEANTTNFEDNTFSRSNVFQWVNAEGSNSDKLVVFGKGKNYEAMGKWDFTKINNNRLSLEDDYFGIDRADLYYAVGHNYYQDQCFEDGREWLGSTDSESYQLDDEGTAIISYKYDYHLTGKDALIWVNLTGYQADTGKNTRIGEVTKHTLRGIGLSSVPSGGYFVDKNSTAKVTFDIKHSEVAEWYRNGHFGYSALPHKCASAKVIDTSNYYDARTCNKSGVGYVTFEVNATVEAPCTFNIGGILVSDEF